MAGLPETTSGGSRQRGLAHCARGALEEWTDGNGRIRRQADGLVTRAAVIDDGERAGEA